MRRLQHTKKWIDRPTRSKRLECERLQKVAHKKSKNNKRSYIDNCIRNTEENSKDKHIRNAYKEVGSLNAGFKSHTDLCRGTNNEEDIKTRWKTYFRGLLTTAAEHSNSLDNTIQIKQPLRRNWKNHQAYWTQKWQYNP